MAMITKRYKMREFPGPTPHSVAILAKPPSKNPRDAIILEGRKRAQIEADRQAIDEDNQKSDMRTEWEIRSEKRIMGSRVRREVDALMRCEEFNLNDRREKLKAILQKEDHDYLEEILSKEETMLERQAKMRERARQLKERRERERLEVVQQKYDQQFRQDCEEVRSTLSKRCQDEICVNRVEQLRQKEEQKMEEQRLNQLYNDMWQKDIQEKAAREEREMLQQAERNKDLLSTLHKQMSALDEQKKKEKELKQEEAKLMEEQRELLKLEQQRAKEFKAQKEAAMRNMLDRSIGIKNRVQAKQEQEELAFDLNALEKLLKETKDEETWKRTRKAELMNEDRKYREYLQYMLDVEKVKEKELNDLIQAEVDKTTAIKAEKMRQERDARRRLLTEVLATRAGQVQDRIRDNMRKKKKVPTATLR